MEQKFYSFEEALEKLGTAAERLNDLREAGQLRAYRDGKSWKFRRDEIDKFAAEGLPEPPEPSDIGFSEGSSLDLTLEPADTDISISDSVGDDDAGESILLSEEELGESVTGPASTIIGKDELDDADLELATDDEAPDLHQSDVRLESETSNVLSSDIAGSGVLDGIEGESASLSAFEDLDELEIDLAAESSRILSPEEAAKAKEQIQKEVKKDEAEELDLDEDLELDADDAMGSTDVSAIELETPAAAEVDDGSEIELAEDDDLVLSDGSGSDITLDPSESGISLGTPSDSGLALDDIPLDAGSSAILSSLSLGGEGGSDPEISLLGSDPAGEASASGLQADDDFQLTPMGDTGDDESSSQVIALDAEIEGLADEPADAGGFEDAPIFDDADDDGVVLAEDYSGEDDALGAAGYTAAPVAAATETAFSVPNILALSSCALLLCVCGIMMLDMIRNIWSWDEPYALNSSLIEALLGIFGIG